MRVRIADGKDWTPLPPDRPLARASPLLSFQTCRLGVRQRIREQQSVNIRLESDSKDERVSTRNLGHVYEPHVSVLLDFGLLPGRSSKTSCHEI